MKTIPQRYRRTTYTSILLGFILIFLGIFNPGSIVNSATKPQNSYQVKTENNTAQFYVDTNSRAKQQANDWRYSRPNDAAKMDILAALPTGKWIVGGSNQEAYNNVKDYIDKAFSQGQVGVLIAYNIPGRDCNSYSAGGASSADSYRRWIESFANAISDRNAIVVLEPDALSGIDCLDINAQNIRKSLLRYSVEVLKLNRNTKVYIDAGNSNWIDALPMAQRLKSAGISLADGFALNVSNFYWTSEIINFGTKLSSLTEGKHFIIDTSRNGSGPTADYQWCNPKGRSIGEFPTQNTKNSLVDAFLWLKVPGESDGNCNGGPNAGEWWPEYALELVNNVKNLPTIPQVTVLVPDLPESPVNTNQTIETWWPIENINISGVQPFKALLKNYDLKNYSMYWQVDNGQLNDMYDSFNDAPHKEAWVDLTGWNWQSSKRYNISFIAKDAIGNVIATKSFVIIKN